jgi:4-amino-4-deoxy-L-arabinose transferase-like glycosyltransferase
METKLYPTQLNSFLKNRQNLITSGLLIAILALGAFLRFYQLGANGVGNEYYAAAVKSMLLSWKNFFFVAFEPGGSVSLDKPPLGFWIQAVSAYFLGVTGFALALPNAIAGVLSIFVTYKLVRRPFGPWIGLVAALALAVTPVAIVTERNNTIDGLLVFVLLLAAWAFLQSVYTGKLRWLFLGAFIVGLGFNIKMLQAFLPLPAFYAIYFFGAKHGWSKKILHLAAATAVLLVVSLAWAIMVDLTPASARPYVDSSSNNTVMELIFGHNGLERLTRSGGGGPTQAGNGQLNGQRPQPPAGQMAQGQPPQMPAGQSAPQGLDGLGGPQNGGQPGGMGGGGSMDFGTAGTLRLLTAPLAGEASWLLPFVLGGLLLLTILLWKQPFSEQQIALILWAGWLLPETIYFTYSSGLMHAYYLIMLGAPLAALTAMTLWALWRVTQERPLFGWALVMLLAAITLAFQGLILWGKTSAALGVLVLAGILFSGGLTLAAVSRLRVRFVPAALTLVLAAMLVAPATWSALTTFNSSPNSGLPSAGPVQSTKPGQNMARPMTDDQTTRNLDMTAPGNGGGQLDQNLLNYLLKNTQTGTYLLATGRANSAAPYILQTGRPVLTFGGFLGQYDEVTVDQLAVLVKNGQLRFVLGEDLNQHQLLAAWVQQNCQLVKSADYGGAALVSNNLGGRSGSANLYDCGE